MSALPTLGILRPRREPPSRQPSTSAARSRAETQDLEAQNPQTPHSRRGQSRQSSTHSLSAQPAGVLLNAAGAPTEEDGSPAPAPSRLSRRPSLAGRQGSTHTQNAFHRMSHAQSVFGAFPGLRMRDKGQDNPPGEGGENGGEGPGTGGGGIGTNANNNVSVMGSPVNKLEQPNFVEDMMGLGLEEDEKVEEDEGGDKVDTFHMIGEIRPINLRTDSRRLGIAVAIAVSIIVAASITEYVNDEIVFQDMSLRNWALLIATFLLVKPCLNLIARALAYYTVTSRAKPLFKFNSLYFITVLHVEIADLMTYIILLLEWNHWISNQINTNTTAWAISNILTCMLALQVGYLVRNFILILIASTHLWIPYVQRAQSSIFAQYILLILTEYAFTGEINKGLENLACQISQKSASIDKLSLYSVYKSVAFVQQHKLGGSVFAELELSGDLEETVHENTPPPGISEGSSNLVGGKERKKEKARGLTARAYAGGEGSIDTINSTESAKKLGKYLYMRLREAAEEAAAESEDKTQNDSLANDKAKFLSDLNLVGLLFGQNMTHSPAHPHHQMHMGRTPPRDTSPSKAMKRSASAGAISTSPLPTSPPVIETAQSTTAANIQADLNATTTTLPSKPSVTLPADGLTMETFCPPMDEKLREAAFNLLDVSRMGVVTKDVMVQGVIDIYKDHRNLVLTLQDSQQIVNKLGQILACIIGFILFFVCLGIWGYNVGAASITFSSTLLAFTFMFGSMATNLFESIIFVFITSAYDVGDRLCVPDTNQLSRYHNVKVTKINLLTTEFARGDGQYLIMPNKQLSFLPIINWQRSSNVWMEFSLVVNTYTPQHKIDSLKKRLQKYANQTDNNIYHKFTFTLAEIVDGSRLLIKIGVQGRFTWQDQKKKAAVQTATMTIIKRHCVELGIVFQTPETPVAVRMVDAIPTGAPLGSSPTGSFASPLGNYAQTAATHRTNAQNELRATTVF